MKAQPAVGIGRVADSPLKRAFYDRADFLPSPARTEGPLEAHPTPRYADVLLMSVPCRRLTSAEQPFS
jgi:hypothetical protein